MNSIFTELKLFAISEEDFHNNWLPTLDFELKTKNDNLMYSFYEKPLAKNTVIMSRDFRNCLPRVLKNSTLMPVIELLEDLGCPRWNPKFQPLSPVPF